MYVDDEGKDRRKTVETEKKLVLMNTMSVCTVLSKMLRKIKRRLHLNDVLN